MSAGASMNMALPVTIISPAQAMPNLAGTSPHSVIRELFAAVCTGDVDVVRRSLTRSLANYCDPHNGLSLLSWAVSLDRLSIAKLLLERGALLTIRDRNGFIAIHRAVWDASVDMVQLLIEHGADVNAPGAIHTRTPLIFAALRGDAAKASMLLRAGADVEARDTEGMSAVDHATYLGFADVVELLIDAGADCHAARYYCEEGVKLVETVPQKQNFDRIIALMCKPWAPQSVVTVT